MKHLIKTATTFCLSAIGMLAMMSCEGADLYKVYAPDWLADKELPEEVLNIVEVTPNPDKLGAADNTTGFWTVFTDDVKTEPGMTYQLKFVNYGGNSNWKNFVIILRSEDKATEYAVLRADNWGWGTGYTGEESDSHFTKMTEDKRDWGTWLKAMSMAKCTALITNKDNGKADVKITMIGADNVTYTQEYTDIVVDTDNLYFAFTLEGCHLEFGDFDIEDSEPTAITLNGVPSEVVVGTDYEEFISNISAVVTFGEGVNKDIKPEELQFEVIPDFETVGQKTLVVIYNKTYLGNNCSKPVIASKTFNVVKELSAFTQTVVVPTPLVLGATDNTTAFWGAHTENIKIAPKETKVTTFTNHTSGAGNWNNFVIVLCKADNSEYGVVRADNWGWGAGIDGNANFQKIGGFATDDEWTAWRADMEGAKVTTYVTNNGDGTADIKAVMVGNSGTVYLQEYKGINTIDPDNMYFRFTVDGCHLVFDNEVGASDCSTAFWGAHSTNIQVIGHQECTVNFTNYTSGVGNWNNFVIVLCKADNSEYGVVRADNWGWGAGIDGNANFQKIGGFATDAEWATWRGAMNGAKCTAKIVNNGDGTANIKVVMHGTNGVDYTQDYIGINTVDPDNFYFRFTVDGSYLVFE
jgi:hypothetical protein